MTIVQALLGFAAVAAILTVIPGLDTTLVLRSALVRGRGTAIATALGVALGALAWGAAAALGAAALLAASELAFRVVTIGGALYMAYLGGAMLIRSFRRQPLTAVVAHAPAATWRALLVGLTTNLMNPKVGVFYIATIPQFIPEGASALGMGLLLSGVHATLSLLWFAVIITGAAFARRWLAHPRALRIVDRCAGVALIGFGAKLAFDHR